jgi:hypothetical protein
MEDNYIAYLKDNKSIKIDNPLKRDLRFPPPDIENYEIRKTTNTD